MSLALSLNLNVCGAEGRGGGEIKWNLRAKVQENKRGTRKVFFFGRTFPPSCDSKMTPLPPTAHTSAVSFQATSMMP